MTILTTYKYAITPYKKTDIDEECPICLEEYKKKDTISLLACEHFFHSHCVKGVTICPTCRADIQPLVTTFDEHHQFYHLVHQLVKYQTTLNEWSPQDIDDIVKQLEKELSKNHAWNSYVKLKTFNELCNFLNLPAPSKEEAKNIEPFFQDLINHKNFQKMSIYLEKQQPPSLSKNEPENTFSLWDLAKRTAAIVFCIPDLFPPE